MTDYRKETVIKGQKRLRCGYTTGTCAAAAAKAAAAMLFSGEICREIRLTLPGGDRIMLEPVVLEMLPETVKCGIIKDAGDDPDITNGMMVCARIRKTEGKEIVIDGGEGVGRVTRAGLDQPVGAAAINSVPRQMIRSALEEIKQTWHYAGGLSAIISIPGGAEKAAKTLNPVLGIEGGLSVLGTTGIVEPMSEQALVDTIAVDMRMHLAMQEQVFIMAPGNYGLDFLQEHYNISREQVIKISNYIGESLDLAVCMGVSGILMAGHIGKMIKIAGGIMNTHSRQADARMEILTAYTALAGAGTQVLQRIMQSATTDAGLDILKEAGFLEPVMALVLEKIHMHMQRRAGDHVEIGVILFSNVYGLLGQTDNVAGLLAKRRP